MQYTRAIMNTDFPQTERLKSKGKLNSATKIDIEKHKYFADYNLVRRNRIMGGMVFHLCRGLVSFAIFILTMLSITFLVLLVMLISPNISLQDYPDNFFLRLLLVNSGFTVCIQIKGMMDKNSIRLGYIDFYMALSEFDPATFLDKFYRNRFAKLFVKFLRYLSFGKIRLDRSWTVEYGDLLSIVNILQANPQAFYEIAELARNKEELRQMMGVR
jgi:hypothetical protein